MTTCCVKTTGRSITQLANVSIEPKFVNLTADVLGTNKVLWPRYTRIISLYRQTRMAFREYWVKEAGLFFFLLHPIYYPRTTLALPPSSNMVVTQT